MAELFSTRGSFDTVASLVKHFADIEGPCYLRGQPCELWGLQPTIARLGEITFFGKPVPVSTSAVRQEKALLNRFRRRTYEERGRILNEWEALFLARHHGLPVRLLDWTTNPLVALYFACISEEKPKANGAIWIFVRSEELAEIDVFRCKPFDIKGVRMIQPFYPTGKMTAQSGLFTIHDYPWMDLSKAVMPPPFETDILEGQKWIILAEKKESIAYELNRLGVNARTLFPDLSGIAKGLIETDFFRKPPYEKPSYKTWE